MKSFLQFIKESHVWWHGSPSGDLRGGPSGLHLGTKQAARDALTARIGHPAEGEWDGTREYGKTKLAGKKTLAARGEHIAGHNCEAPEHDYFAHEHPRGFPTMGTDTKVSPEHRPEIKSYHLTGKMTNTTATPHADFKANGLMRGMLKKGNAKRGFFYKNDGEDAGSISAVVPGPGHIRKAD